ncbi:hypothetical protein AAFF_G00063070 [Aldrovandia affinis]|uniref:Uncharacterized protein n=1 Tax=Aldrovandia affinis TaxID=143900 RepID=A0AAD7RZL7_9TELE|nr:hypothetical protein AAFF_G00063070 [Aldrovandia affinis]
MRRHSELVVLGGGCLVTGQSSVAGLSGEPLRGCGGDVTQGYGVTGRGKRGIAAICQLLPRPFTAFLRAFSGSGGGGRIRAGVADKEPGRRALPTPLSPLLSGCTCL